jgi:hypothetical protein
MDEREPLPSPPAEAPVRSLTADAKDEASRLASEARQRVGSYVDQRKTGAADRVSRLAGALLQAAHALDEDQEPLGRYAVSAAGRVDGFARYIREADFERLAGDAEAFARRHPAVFIGGAFMAGLVLARFLKSTERRPVQLPVEMYDEAPYGDVPYAEAPAPTTPPAGV